MNIFSKIYWWFSPYTDKIEKKFANFLDDKSNFNNESFAKMKMLEFMQKDLIRLNLYQEWKFKGYKKLKKYYRKNLYKNAKTLKNQFLEFYEEKKNQIEPRPKLENSHFSREKKVFLTCLMQWLSPHHNFHYEKSCAFEKLLRDPRKEKLVGDCNQICSLYLAIYAEKFEISDWKVKILPQHVCLHFGGVDIECTSGAIKNYENGKILPVEEMITTNMLDISDENLKIHKISANNMEKVARIVLAVSSEKELARKNLKVAYHNLALNYLEENSFLSAIKYFKLANENEKIQNVYHQAVNYFVKNKEFSRAEKFAKKSDNKNLWIFCQKSLALDLLNRKKFNQAENIYEKIGDYEGQKICWNNYLHSLNQKIQYCKTLPDFREKKSILKNMKKTAYKLNNQSVVKFCDDILKQI